MIVYGAKYRLLSSHDVPGTCPQCEAEHTVELFIYQKYFHLFWIPFFPMSRGGETICHNCRQALTHKELSPNARLLFADLRTHDRTPIWMFSGLVLLAIMIPLAFWQSGRHDEQVKALLADPRSGDLYEIDLEKGGYTLFKVSTVQVDSITVKVGQYETDRARGLTSLKYKEEEDMYGEEFLRIARADLTTMHDKRVIMDVQR